MAIIYSYQTNTDILATDLIIGSSTKVVNGKKKNVTKNFQIASIAEFYNEISAIAIAGQNNFFFQNLIAPGRKPGSISFISGSGTGTPFSNITVLRISKFATSGNVIIDYINTLVGEAIMIAQCDNLNNFGIYKFISITPVVGNTNFFDIVIESVNAHGSILEDKFYAVAVYPGFVNPDIDPGSNYTFTSPLVNTAGVVSIGQSSNTTDGYLSSVDWNIFNNKQNTLNGTGLVKSVAGTISYITDNSINWDSAYADRITSLTTTGTGAATLISNVLNIPTPSSATFVSLTTTGNSGVSTLIGGILNIPTYTLAGLGGISLTSLSSSATGLTYTNTTGVFSLTSGYLIPTTVSYNNTNWDTAYTNRITNLTTTGTGAATLISNVLNIPTPPTATFTSLTTSGSSGLSTLIGGVLNVPGYTLAGLGGVPTSRTLTINGTAYDLSADRTWNVGTVTSVSATSPITSSGGTTPTISTSMATNKLIGRSTAGTGVMEEITIGTGLTLSAGTLSNANSGTVTSVGLTMPSAFIVSSSPVTGAGTIAVTGAGVSSQYVRGDGTLANFPTSTGGGASVSYYLNGSISQGTIGGVAYKELNSVPVIGTGTDFSINADGYIAQFITDVGDPNKLLIPSGNWNFETYFSASSNGGSPQFYIELYKYNGTTFTLIATNSATPEFITGGTNIDLYFTALAVPPTTLAITDRLAVRFYVIHSGRTITMHTENSHLSQVITTFSSGLTALNGLTSQVQYFAVGTSGTDFNISSATDTHTFNLPTASATNRGALSSADWITFNSKQNALTNPITGTGTTNYLPKFTGASVLGDSAAQDNGTSIIIEKAISSSSAAPLMTRNLTPYSAPNYNQFSQIWLNSGGGIMAYIRNDGTFLTTNAVKSNYHQGAIAGSASAPVFNFGDTTGLFFPSSTNIAFTTASAEKMRITSAGNVGIGTTAPAAKLQVNAPGALSTDIAFKIRNSADTLDLVTVNGLGTLIGKGFQGTYFYAGTTYYDNARIYIGSTSNAKFQTFTSGFSIEQGALTTIAPTAIFELKSTTQGFLPPRMTNAQMNAIASPAVGLCVYCTDVVEGLYINKSTGWTFII